MKNERIEAPAKLLERLRPVQEQIDRWTTEINIALLAAKIVLDVPEDWVWDGGGWVAPHEGEKGSDDVA